MPVVSLYPALSSVYVGMVLTRDNDSSNVVKSVYTVSQLATHLLSV
jgi:hypothetical protein